MRFQPALFVLLSVSACTLEQTNPNLVATAATVRVTREPDSVKACTFLGAVSATEQPGYTTTRGLTLVEGVPAITVLQARAGGMGADTVEVTNSETSYRAAASSGSGRASTLTTVTGNAYKCASAAPAVAAQNPQSPVAANGLTGRWEVPGSHTDRMTDIRKTGAVLASVAGGARLVVACTEVPGSPKILSLMVHLPAAIEGTGTTPTQIRFDADPAVTIDGDLTNGGVTVQFRGPDTPTLLRLVAVKDRLLVKAPARDGSPIFEFDLRGAGEAMKPAIASCSPAH